jgi:hypothetical protein
MHLENVVNISEVTPRCTTLCRTDSTFTSEEYFLARDVLGPSFITLRAGVWCSPIITYQDPLSHPSGVLRDTRMERQQEREAHRVQWLAMGERFIRFEGLVGVLVGSKGRHHKGKLGEVL